MSAAAPLTPAKPAAQQDTPPTIKLLVGGEFIESQSEEWRDIMNPATQEVLVRVPFATAGEVDAAIRSIHATFTTWKNTPVSARMRIMPRFQTLIRERSSRIVRTLMAEQGKTLPDAEGGIFCGLEVVEHTCSVGSLQQDEFLESTAGMVDTYTLCQPIDVCAGIMPSSFPAIIPLQMFLMATMYGNMLVLRPSKQDSLSTIQLAGLVLKVGVLPSVLNVMHGNKDVVGTLCTHEHVKAISFVGLTTVGTHVYHLGSGHGKCVQSMMGVGSHAMVLPDMDHEQAINVLAGAAFGAARQRCMATSAVVPADAAQQWVSNLIAKAKTLEVNASVGPGADVGPVVSCTTKQRILGLTESSVQQGATLALDSRSVHVAGYEDSNFIDPTISTDMETDMDIYTNEVFGSVLPTLTVPTLDDAITLANTNPFGNGMDLFTQNGASTRKLQNEIDVGQVGINILIPMPVPCFSFTGLRGSKLGDLDPYSKQVMQFYTQAETVTTRQSDDTTDAGGVSTTISLR